MHLGCTGTPSRVSSMEGPLCSYKLECPKFDDIDFQGWWSKLEQYFDDEGVVDNAKVRTVVLHLEGKTLNWHHFYTQKQGGFHLLKWDSYARRLKERFGSCFFQDPWQNWFS